MGSREDVAARIEADTKIKIEEMNKAVNLHKEAVSIFIVLRSHIFIYFFYSLYKVTVSTTEKCDDSI